MRICVCILMVLPVVLSFAAARADSADELLKKVQDALAKKQVDDALKLADKAIELDAKNPTAFLLRGTVHEAMKQHDKAIADFDRALKLDGKLADAYQRRGCEHFKAGHFAESLADFDKFLELRPDARPGHWQRGITCYYAGKFEEGRKQFEGYEKVDTNDVENAVWHFLCAARAGGVDKARAGILKIGNDRRVPMMQVYALFAGKAKPEDVMASVAEDNPPEAQLHARLFYAHLYLGLYYDVVGDKKKALEHMAKADDDYKIGHYMWDVAHVHRDLLRKDKK